MNLQKLKEKYPQLDEELLKDIVSTIIDTNVSAVYHRVEANKRQSKRLRTALFVYHQQHFEEVGGCDFEEFYRRQTDKWIERVKQSV